MKKTIRPRADLSTAKCDVRLVVRIPLLVPSQRLPQEIPIAWITKLRRLILEHQHQEKQLRLINPASSLSNEWFAHNVRKRSRFWTIAFWKRQHRTRHTMPNKSMRLPSNDEISLLCTGRRKQDEHLW